MYAVMLWKLFERFKPESSGRVLLYLKGKETKIPKGLFMFEEALYHKEPSWIHVNGS